MQRYGQEWKASGRADEELQEFGPIRWEWHRVLCDVRKKEEFEMLCCPEDVNATKCTIHLRSAQSARCQYVQPATAI